MTWTEKRLVIDGPVKLADGYGHMTMNMIQAFHNLGYEVFCRRDWTHTDLTHVPGLVKHLVETNAIYRSNLPHVGVRMSTPESASSCPTQFRINYSMWEFTRLPDSWARGAHGAHLAMVPSQWCKDLWVNAGVQVPVEVNQLGVDPTVFTYKERTVHDRPFTFVMTGTISERKAPWLTWQAFRAAFGDRKDVRLIVKTPAWLPIGRGDHPRQVPPDDERIIIYNEVWPDEKMVALLHEADAFLYPTRSEGWGLSPHQAMATGLPVICTNASSCTEYMKEEHSYPLAVEGIEPVPSHWGEIGGFYTPSLDHLIELMRHVEANRKEAIAKGKKAADYVRSWLTWEHNAQRFIDIVSKYV